MYVAPAPELHALMSSLDSERLMKVVRSQVTEEGNEYVHWDKLRRRTPPSDLTHEEWWLGIKLGETGSCARFRLPTPKGSRSSTAVPTS